MCLKDLIRIRVQNECRRSETLPPEEDQLKVYVNLLIVLGCFSWERGGGQNLPGAKIYAG
jgi:hypothetical protein